MVDFSRLKDPNFLFAASDVLGQMANMPLGNVTGVGQSMQTYQQGVQAKAQEAATKNATLEYLKANNPDLYQAVSAGTLTPPDAFKMAYQQKMEAQKPKTMPGAVQEYEYARQNGFQGTFMDFKTANQKPLVTINDEMGQRRAAAAEAGLKPTDPAYQSFLLTGKLPREDQAPLTATDKKAILEADEMVMTNEAAIKALKQAKSLSDTANSGWLAGTRATIGNNLPDYMVPDAISSPESSAATTNFDNAVVGQALTQLKAIFGGAPTEGERKILLDLQGSSGLPASVRKDILDRAIAAAEARLDFNRRRSEELRSGEFYKSNASPNSGQTTSGIKFSIEGQ